MQCFNGVLIRDQQFWKIQYLEDLPKHGTKKMKEAKTKAKGIRQGKMEKPCQRKDGHNREPIEQSYYWGSGWLMDYSLEKLSGCNVLIRF